MLTGLPASFASAMICPSRKEPAPTVAMLRQQRDIKDVKFLACTVQIQAAGGITFKANNLMAGVGMLRRVVVFLRLILHADKLLLLLRRPWHLRHFLLARAAINLEQKLVVRVLHGTKCYLSGNHYDLRKRWNTAS